jgi:predicted RNase H-like nuclease
VAERQSLGRKAVARDDIIDAAACLVAASRCLHGAATVLPSNAVEYDARGLRMEIVA